MHAHALVQGKAPDSLAYGCRIPLTARSEKGRPHSRAALQIHRSPRAGDMSDHETAIFRGLVSSRLFSVMCSTPSDSFASTFRSSTVGGSVKLRRNR